MKKLFLLIFISAPIFAAAKYPAVDGPFALELYELETNGEPSPDTVDLFGGCHYGGSEKNLVVRFCEFPDGFINPPIRDQISKLIQDAGIPVEKNGEEWLIGFHFKCTHSTAHCDLDKFDSDELP